MEEDVEDEAPGAEVAQKPAPTRRRWMLVPLLLAVAAGGFGVGRVGATVMAPETEAPQEVLAPEALEAGRFAVTLQGDKVMFVEAAVLIDRTNEGPESPAELRDALLGLLSEAAALPLVQHADDTLAMLERSAMAMAAETAPWLAGLDLAAAMH